jgi:glyoxylase-like metal-dependent hydrolase (beta-lactamase superfamily II)
MAFSPVRHLSIPLSTSTVSISIIDNNARLWGLPGSFMMSRILPGFERGGAKVPSYSFLIHHTQSNTRLLFDLGLRSDWESVYHSGFVKGVHQMGLEMSTDKDVADILLWNSEDLISINTIIYSHHHFDHTGSTSKFPSSTGIVVGPGYIKTHLPGFPENPRQFETTSDLYQGRAVEEVDFSFTNPKVLDIGGFKATDYFSDGSFYLLDTPGHTVGHISALARTTSDQGQSTFIFMGGDIAHTQAIFRPSPRLPLPETIPDPNQPPFTSTISSSPYTQLHPSYGASDSTLARSTPFGNVPEAEHDPAMLQISVNKLVEFDGEEDILVVLAHDASLLDVVDLYPEGANEWKKKGWKEQGHWRFLGQCVLEQGSDGAKL